MASGKGDPEGDEERISHARLEVWRSGSLASSVLLDSAELTIGRTAGCDIRLDDQKASRQHAVVQRTGRSGWRITDLDSSNGTYVNGQRIRTNRPLRHRDRISIGDAELVFEDEHPVAREGKTVADTAARPPELTRRELDLLKALCRPLLGDAPFPVAASTREIANEMFVSDSAVRHLVDRLYNKFGIYDEDPDSRRHHLATEAIRRGVIGE
jgi:hypothetical protein